LYHGIGVEKMLYIVLSYLQNNSCVSTVGTFKFVLYRN